LLVALVVALLAPLGANAGGKSIPADTVASEAVVGASVATRRPVEVHSITGRVVCWVAIIAGVASGKTSEAIDLCVYIATL
jgi:hypothetical protein